MIFRSKQTDKIRVSSTQKQLFIASKNHGEFTSPPIQTYTKTKFDQIFKNQKAHFIYIKIKKQDRYIQTDSNYQFGFKLAAT